MLRLKAMTSFAKEKVIAATTTTATTNDDVAVDEGGKGMQVLLELMEPWNHSDHLVIGNAYFTSVEAALKLKEKDLFLFLLGTSSSAAGGSQCRFMGTSPSQSIDKDWCLH